MKTPEQILKAKKCGDLFENNIDKIKAEYKELARAYHPDLYKEDNANEILANLNTLYDRALEFYQNGVWEQSNSIFIRPKEKKITFKFRYLAERTFELGKFYISGGNVVYLLDNEHKKYYDNAIKQIQSLKYANEKMHEEFARYMPNLKSYYETEEGKWCIIMAKTEDVYLLNDLLKQQGGKMDDKHVAWVISRLSNITCFLQYNNIIHNGISLNNCYVSPNHHSILLLGGWWYATKENEKIIGTQKEIFNIMPLKAKTEKVPSYKTDLESIKLIGKLLLNNRSLMTKRGTFDFTPEPFKNFLRKGASENPKEEFKLWNKALEESYGERKFIVLNVQESDIYA